MLSLFILLYDAIMDFVKNLIKKKSLLKFSEIIEKALTSMKARNARVLSKGSNSRKLQKLI